MATTTTTLKTKLNKIDIKNFIATALIKFSESLGDMIVSVAVTGVALMWMSVYAHPILVDLVSPYYITAMLLQLLIRVVHRFDDSYTTEELAERILEFEAATTGRLDEIIRNDIS